MKTPALAIAKRIVGRLTQAGHPAYFAGGAVRDMILGQEVNEVDIATSARPEVVEKLFDKTVLVGKQFGVVVVMVDGHPFQVATFRQEHGFTDQRHPDQIMWTTAEEDAKRRDLTINGLFFDPFQEQVIDYVGGQADLKKKLIRFIGEANKRIEEDCLRLLRAIRLKNQLAFEYEPSTWQAIVQNASAIARVSADRIRDEFDKMLLLPTRDQAVKELSSSGLLQYILPEVEALKGVDQSWKFRGEGDVFRHTLIALRALGPTQKVDLAWGVLLHDIGKPPTAAQVPDKKFGGERLGFYNHHSVGAELAERLLRRLHFPNDRIELITWLVRHHMMVHEILEMRAGRQRRWLLDPRLPDLLELHRADASGKEEGRRINLEAYERVKKLREAELAKPPPPPKLIDGHEIMKEFNLQPGPEVGRLLKLVEDAVWDGRVKAKEEALDYLRQHAKIKS